MSNERIRPDIVENFHLTVGEIARQYMLLPANCPNILFHYTTMAGLEGILRSGGLRATYRMKMNDSGEFDYAQRIIYEAMKEVEQQGKLPRVAMSLLKYTRLNLNDKLKNTPDQSRSYCACLTLESDHPNQWESYAEHGKGVAIGFDLRKLFQAQVERKMNGMPILMFGPVTYEELDQQKLVLRLVEAGIKDLQLFSRTISSISTDIVALRDKITEELIVYLFVLINFIKRPSFGSEREIRLMINANDGTLLAPDVQYYKRGDDSVPYVLIDLITPKTGLIPIEEIKIGPKVPVGQARRFIGDLILQLGYGNRNEYWPQISQSRLVAE